MGTASVTDSLSLSDQLTLALGVSVADSYTLSDAAAAQMVVSVGARDTLTFTDSVRYTIFSPFVRVAGDAINISDGIAFTGTGVLAAADTLSLSDSIGIFHGQDNPQTDSVSLSDAVAVSLVSVFSNLTISVSDTLELHDSVSFGSPHGTTVGDKLFFQDNIQISLNSSLNAYLRRYLNDTPTPH